MPTHRSRGMIERQVEFDGRLWPTYPMMTFECQDISCLWYVKTRSFTTAIEAANQHAYRMNRSQEVSL